MTTPTSILLTGASGYVGGTILSSLSAGKNETTWIKSVDISALVRNEAQAAVVRESGFKAVQLANYDDIEAWTTIAENYDVVVHAAAGWNLRVSQAIIKGLGNRRRETQRKVHFFGISGVTNIADRPITGQPETRTLSDEDDMYAYMKQRQAQEEYMPRAADLAVVEGGLEHGVETHIVMAPHIFGVGTGSFNRFTFPVNMIVKGAQALGKGFVIGDGTAAWSHVHVQDLADLYLVLLRRVVEGESIPSGKKGIYFAESGLNSQLEMAEKVARAAKELGLLPSDEVAHIDLGKGTQLFGSPAVAELGGASNARIKGVLGRSLGWKPKREAEWETAIRHELEEFEKKTSTPQDSDKLATAT